MARPWNRMSPHPAYERPSPEAIAFMEALVASLRTGPIAEADVHFTHRTGATVEIRGFSVRGERGTGRGTAAFEAILAIADATGADLHVQPHAEGPGGTDRLDAWYRRMGLVDGEGRGRLSYRAGSRSAPAP